MRYPTNPPSFCMDNRHKLTLDSSSLQSGSVSHVLFVIFIFDQLPLSRHVTHSIDSNSIPSRNIVKSTARDLDA